MQLCYVILNVDAQKSNGMKEEKEFKKPSLNKVSADTLTPNNTHLNNI